MMTWSSPMMTPPSLSQVTWEKAPPHAPEVLMDGLLMLAWAWQAHHLFSDERRSVQWVRRLDEWV